MFELKVELLKIIGWPLISFTAFAYGADWISKQTSWGSYGGDEYDIGGY